MERQSLKLRFTLALDQSFIANVLYFGVSRNTYISAESPDYEE